MHEEEVYPMNFYQTMREIVLDHGAVNNPYLTRFRDGDLKRKDMQEFAQEFYNFARFFPKILVAQLINTENEYVADELTKVLYSELGEGQPANRHERLYRSFLRSLNIEVHDAITRPMLPSTRTYIEGMEQLYSDGNHFKALGASFGLENMAIRMWDHLIPGLLHMKSREYPMMDITYFTFHRQLETSHEEAMEQALAVVEQSTGTGLSDQEKETFQDGMVSVLSYLEGFWTGLEHLRTTSETSRQTPCETPA
jgi:pyrroloquinoline-quinone synthase